MNSDLARSLTSEVLNSRKCRWVGVYEVTDDRISLVAHTGTKAPAFPSFPVTQGLSGVAISTKTHVISNDVRNDPRYLTAFGSSGSEMIVPIIERDIVVGTVDLESDELDAFRDEDAAVVDEIVRRVLSTQTR